MKIAIKSRAEVEKMAKTPFSAPTALVSICDFGGTPARLEHSPQFLLRLAFDDVDNDIFLDSPGEDPAAVAEKYHLFSDGQAQAVADFYRQICDSAELLICQCEHGQSRSAAIAAALLEFRRKRGIEIFANDRYYPNKVVFRKTLEHLRHSLG